MRWVGSRGLREKRLCDAAAVGTQYMEEQHFSGSVSLGGVLTCLLIDVICIFPIFPASLRVVTWLEGCRMLYESSGHSCRLQFISDTTYCTLLWEATRAETSQAENRRGTVYSVKKEVVVGLHRWRWLEPSG